MDPILQERFDFYVWIEKKEKRKHIYKEYNRDFINHQIGRNIKKIRNKKGLFQRELAKIMGLERETISDFECGRSNIHIHHLLRISAILECSILDLLKGCL